MVQIASRVRNPGFLHTRPPVGFIATSEENLTNTLLCVNMYIIAIILFYKEDHHKA